MIELTAEQKQKAIELLEQITNIFDNRINQLEEDNNGYLNAVREYHAGV